MTEVTSAPIELERTPFFKHLRFLFPECRSGQPPFPDQRQAERVFGFITCQPHSGIQDHFSLPTIREFGVLRGDPLGNLCELLATGEFMFQYNEQLFEFNWQRNDWSQDQNDRAVLLASDNLLREGLDDFCGLHKTMKVLQHQKCCSIGRGERVERPDRGQRITRPRINFGAGNLQSLLNIPGRHSPVFLATKLRDRDERIGIPMTSGRGYSSLPPRKAMVDRFVQSGRENLIVIVVSDFDPEGEDIPGSFGASLRDDFGIHPDKLQIIKGALTAEQVQTMHLHAGQFSKTTSSRYKRFVKEHGERCWELESLTVEQLREITESVIREVLDLEAFETEVLREQSDQLVLTAKRREMQKLLTENINQE